MVGGTDYEEIMREKNILKEKDTCNKFSMSV